MDIGAMSMEMSLVRVRQSSGISIAQKAMDVQEIAADGILRMTESARPKQDLISGVGQIVDTRA